MLAHVVTFMCTSFAMGPSAVVLGLCCFFFKQLCVNKELSLYKYHPLISIDFCKLGHIGGLKTI